MLGNEFLHVQIYDMIGSFESRWKQKILTHVFRDELINFLRGGPNYLSVTLETMYKP